jgi:ferric-dicitrate binding protein FerR (iron transport regulator)
MDKKLVENFFNNQTTPEESLRVLDWFESADGKRYLQKRLQIDADLMDRSEINEWVTELNSEKLYKSIQDRIHTIPKLHHRRKNNWVGTAVKIGAAVLVIACATVLTNLFNPSVNEESSSEMPVVFETREGENRNIELADGTIIRMNSNSEILVRSDYLKGTREIQLTGEAYFEVKNNPEQPFIIYTEQSSVEVLGTSFNVRSVKEQGNVQIAVLEGKVAFRSHNNGANSENLSVQLSQNQYAFLDLSRHSMDVDDLAVNNYLAWKDGRFMFNSLTLEQVCLQLNRIYSVECRFSSSNISSTLLTASFSAESLEKTLSVISLTLGLTYEVQQDKIYWTS